MTTVFGIDGQTMTANNSPDLSSPLGQHSMSVLTANGQIPLKSGVDINGSQMMEQHHFGDRTTVLFACKKHQNITGKLPRH